MFESEAVAEAAVTKHIGEALDGAEAMLEQALEQYPNSANLLYLSASVAVENNDMDSAIDGFIKVLELAPGYDVARFQFAFLATTLGQHDVALQHFDYLANTTQTDYLHQFSTGFCHLLKDNNESAAIADIQRGISNNKDNHALNGNMAKVIAMLQNENTDETTSGMVPNKDGTETQIATDASALSQNEQSVESESKQDDNPLASAGLSSGALLNIYNRDE